MGENNMPSSPTFDLGMSFQHWIASDRFSEGWSIRGKIGGSLHRSDWDLGGGATTGYEQRSDGQQFDYLLGGVYAQGSYWFAKIFGVGGGLSVAWRGFPFDDGSSSSQNLLLSPFLDLRFRLPFVTDGSATVIGIGGQFNGALPLGNLVEGGKGTYGEFVPMVQATFHLGSQPSSP